MVDGKNIARLRVLKTGRAVGGDWQVLDGLKPGDQLIVEGLQKVHARHASQRRSLCPDRQATGLPVH